MDELAKARDRQLSDMGERDNVQMRATEVNRVRTVGIGGLGNAAKAFKRGLTGGQGTGQGTSQSASALDIQPSIFPSKSLFAAPSQPQNAGGTSGPTSMAAKKIVPVS